MLEGYFITTTVC